MGGIPRRGRKPVIYIYSPTPRAEVSVNLTLSDSWSLSAVWPCTPSIQRVGSSFGQVAEWLVSTSPDGTLKDKHTGMEVTYLYWEALANVKPLSPQVTGLDSTAECFDPAKPSLSVMDSVLLPVSKVGHYLDKALSALALNAEARTSFITFWLPDLLKSPYIALRFVPQEQYARAAQLDISPKPDVTTRIFILFRGVNEDEVSFWTVAAERAEDDVSFWKAVVGIDEIAARDEAAFRVLEWGGMEV
ncbi:hypothetical protein PENSPDRAFT_574544 [Peniophora sp. CONT]|nr:hypothetical protein PENSPDRAFT_574544 [Peniophora sp. CONT]